VVLALVQDMIFCTLLYWIVGYANDAGRYFFWCFCGIAMDLCMSAMFRFVARAAQCWWAVDLMQGRFPLAAMHCFSVCSFYAIAAPSQEFAGVLAGAGTGLELVYGGEYITLPVACSTRHLAAAGWEAAKQPAFSFSRCCRALPAWL